VTGPFRVQGLGRVDQSKPHAFRFDGRSFSGLAGDTLASALLANSQTLFGRSFKYHRPRGLLGSGVDEPNALVELSRGPDRREPNLAATTVELYEGLEARSQNRWPSLALDAGALNGLISPVLSSGFYYKTFMWPRSAWARLYEPVIRRMAGLGRAPTLPDPDRYAFTFAHCEVLIVGAGPAGLSAALAAARTGVRVIVCDEGSEPGGSILAAPKESLDGVLAESWLEQAVATLKTAPNVTLLTRTTATSHGIDNMIMMVERLTDHQPLDRSRAVLMNARWCSTAMIRLVSCWPVPRGPI